MKNKYNIHRQLTQVELKSAKIAQWLSEERREKRDEKKRREEGEKKEKRAEKEEAEERR